MALNAYIGSSRHEAREKEPAFFIQAWTHQALMAAVDDQDENFSQLNKISDYGGNATYLSAEVDRLDEELQTLEEELMPGSLVAQFISTFREACQEAIEAGENLYFFGEGVE